MSRKALRPRDRILIHFKGKYISQSNVAGIVTECVEVKEGFRISVVFAYAKSNKDYCRKTDNALSRIESLYHQQSMQQAS